MNQPKVAIVTRTKDRPLLLERTIKSVLNQKFNNWTHIIVNDGGNKKLLEKITDKYKEQYSNKLKLVHIEISKDKWAAANTGMKSIDSDYCILLDDDDTWEEDFLKKTVQYLETNTSIDAVMTHSYYITEKVKDNKIEIIDKSPINTHIKNINLFETIINKVYPPTMSFLYRRRVYNELNGYNETFAKSADIEFVLRLLEKFEIDVIPECLSSMHVRPYNEGCYLNTTMGSSSTLDNNSHKDLAYWENKIKSQLLRRDFESGNIGLGFVYNFINSYASAFKGSTSKPDFSKYKGKRIGLYGAGIKLNEIIQSHKDEFKSLNILGIFDQNQKKQGTFVQNLEVFSPTKIKELKPEVIILTVANKAMVKPFLEKYSKENQIDYEIVADLDI